MKKWWIHFYDARLWLFVLFTMSVFFIFLAWLAYPEEFFVLVGLMVGVSFLLAIVPIIISIRREKEFARAYKRFLTEPDEEQEAILYHLLPKIYHPIIQQTGQQLREQMDAQTRQDIHIQDYETYIEEWVHEIKRPLSLITLVLDNREDEMSPLVQQRMSHARNEMQSDVEKILYFSRLRTVQRDYVFELIDLHEICLEAADEHQSILEEAKVQIALEGESKIVFSDRKSLLFIFSQVLHNAAKYTESIEAMVRFRVEEKEHIYLYIEDNGCGVSQSDLPFIFDKGFTGGKAKATGMGLYLSKRLAEDLNIELAAIPSPNGLRLSLKFPKINTSQIE